MVMVKSSDTAEALAPVTWLNSTCKMFMTFECCMPHIECVSPSVYTLLQTCIQEQRIPCI